MSHPTKRSSASEDSKEVDRCVSIFFGLYCFALKNVYPVYWFALKNGRRKYRKEAVCVLRENETPARGNALNL